MSCTLAYDCLAQTIENKQKQQQKKKRLIEKPGQYNICDRKICFNANCGNNHNSGETENFVKITQQTKNKIT